MLIAPRHRSARALVSACGRKRQSDHQDLDHEYKGQDSEVQLRELREYVELRGWQINEIYTDSVSGTKNSRPGLDKLMADAARRRFDVLVVWRFDRFARSVQRSSLPKHRACYRISKNVRCAPVRTTNASKVHGFRHEHGDGAVAGKRAERCAGPNEKGVVIDGMPAILYIGEDRIANLLSHR